MKRSAINALIAKAKIFFVDMHFALPPFAFWSPDDWKTKLPDAQEIIDVGMGWDITDFGCGEFEKMGLLLITIRNGRCGDQRYSKPYAEKIMIVGEEQITLTHYHWKKAEDIINRGGGNLVIRLHNATNDDSLADTPVAVRMDGVIRRFPAGTEVTLRPGESITLTPRLYHSFWGKKGSGMTLVGEVSTVNDDHADNCFLEPQLRFPTIEEDEPPIHLLVGDYNTLK